MKDRPLIEIDDMSRTFDMGEVKVHALMNVSLNVEPNQVTVILGPSGSGKTTLLNQIGGIDSPTNGSIKVGEKELFGLSQKELTNYRRDNIGFIFQFFNLIPNLTAKENLEFVLEYVMNRPSGEIEGEANDLLKKVGLGKRGDHYPFQLSGGEQQRVAIARALAKDPKILLADEPTGELDYSTGKKILDLLISFANEDRAVLIVTHNKELAKIAHKVFYLKDGKVVKEETNNSPLNVSQIEW